tara:strand:- start:8355 stop:9761 length:1407 start_codon:yes stop_codon:yes gene_type:complete
MAIGFIRMTRNLSAHATAVLAVALICSAPTIELPTASGGGFGGQGGRSVGGVMIDSSGIVRTATIDEKQELANLMRVVVQAPEGEMAEAVEMRMVSLKGLQQAIRDNHATGKPLPESISFLAGLQRVQYVFVDKENQDIVIAGPAEPWKLLNDGSVVGTVTGGAVMQLDDLIVAMQSVETARNGGISCSIEPTDEGRQRLQQLLRRIKLQSGQNPSIYEESMKQAFGPQMIQLAGVQADTHFARTLVAADYEMKRIAMGIVASPIKQLPSYLQMAKNARHNANQNPRWWMACNYDTLRKSEDGMAWKLSGQGVKTETEQDVIGKDGSVKGAANSDKTAALWAQKMTEQFDRLSKEMPVFADLRNVIDLTVVATLITQERLDQKAGIDLSVLREKSDYHTPVKFAEPKAVEPQCSFVRGRSGWVVTASGGVDINGFVVVQKQEIDASLASAKTSAISNSDQSTWWWDKQ